jgi:formate hydrogenlyase subunit 4
MAMMLHHAAQFVQIMLVVALAPLVVGITRKVRARLLRRIGPPVWQPYLDFWKLLHKEVVLADNASWLYRTTPYFSFAVIWVAAAMVPTFATHLTPRLSDLIAIVALLATARFAIALAGMDTGTAFGGIGSSREMLIASLAEPAMLLAVFTVALVAGTTDLSAVAATFISKDVGLRVSLGLAVVAFVALALAENARIPVDNPATHLELTMVHEAMVLEYSGRHLAMIELAAALKLLLYFSLLACLFVPFGMATSDRSLEAMGIGLAAYLGKILLFAILLPVGEVAVAKMRVFRYPVFLGGAFAAGALAVFLLFVSRSL